MSKLLMLAMPVALCACTPSEKSVANQSEIEGNTAREEAQGRERGEAIVQATRIDTLDARVKRLEADVATLQARAGAVDDLKHAMADMSSQQAATINQQAAAPAPAGPRGTAPPASPH